VLGEVGHRARPAPSLQVLRRREDARADEAERSCDEPVVGELPDPEREVEALVHEIHEPLRERDLDMHVGIPHRESHETRRQQPLSEVRGSGDSDRPARRILELRHGGRRFVDAGERSRDGFVVGAARLGEL
jgi:hypothetical protein